MSYSLSRVDTHRASNVEEFLDLLPEVRKQNLGALAVSIHSNEMTPTGTFGRNLRTGVPVLFFPRSAVTVPI